jgi:serpin B
MQILTVVSIFVGLFLMACLAFAEVPEEIDFGLVKADNDFGFVLFTGLAEMSQHENVFISPLSIAMALQMCYNGAEGETKTQMASTMMFAGMPTDVLNIGNKQLIAHLTQSEKVRMEIANSIWSRRGMPFNERFISTLTEFYGASANERSFDDPATLKEINGWVAEKTHGKIEEIIRELDPLSILVLINAVYFKGAWFEQFSPNITREDDFRLHNGDIQKVMMMFKSDNYSYLETEEFQAVRLRYEDPRFEMVIFLPAEDNELDDFIKNKDSAWWTSTASQFQWRDGRLSLPRFKVEYELTLNDALMAMGMKDAFKESSADFSAMTPLKPAWISKVIHKTYIEVDEEGTEAAAVTAIEMVGETMAPDMDRPEPFTMRVDRPFFCAITERGSGALLFMGAIFKPN